MSTLLELINVGQSYWLDNLSRRMIQNGELQQRVSQEGLRGVTSNPAIFNKAISKSRDYDDQIFEFVKTGQSVQAIYEALVIEDVQQACDILRTVYDDSDGVDGFVSLEVSPHLAYATKSTMNEARRLFEAVGRPNLMIKIPGTLAGVPAIEEMLYEGININITLLFSVERYEKVAEAYLRAMERRLAAGKSLNQVASVASVFLSRIDTLVDKILNLHLRLSNDEEREVRAELLFGQAAIATAKLTYRRFLKIFSPASDRWRGLAEKGVRVQRPLWASTSTKDPRYSDVKYVEPLIGPDTINTMPEETIEAFADHGIIQENSIFQGIDDVQEIMNHLTKLGIDPEKVAWQLEHEGVQKFIEPYNLLLESLALKQEQLK